MLRLAFIASFSHDISQAITMASFLVTNIVFHSKFIATACSDSWKVVEFIICLIAFESNNVWFASTLSIVITFVTC